MLKIFIRTVILYLAILIGLRFMGKRQLGELELNELAITMLLSDLASTPLQDPELPLEYGLLSVFTLLVLSMLLSLVQLKSLRFRKLFCGDPTLIIRDGKLMQKAMRRNRFTIDELIGELRVQGITDLSSVEYAILETNGQLSVLQKTASKPVTAQALRIPTAEVTLPVTLINDGRLLRKNLLRQGLDEGWLAETLRQRGLSSPHQVFFLSIDQQGKLLLVEK